MGCFEVDKNQIANMAAEMLNFMKSPEGEQEIVKIAKILPDVAKVDYLNLMMR